MKYPLLFIPTLVAISLAGCVSQPQRPAATNRPAVERPAATNLPAVVWTKDAATIDEIDEAKKAVINQLKDPESARFGEIWALSGSNGKRSLCGYVNAKNSYGGYTGRKIFTIIPPDSVVIEGSGVMGSLLPGICIPRTVK